MVTLAGADGEGANKVVVTVFVVAIVVVVDRSEQTGLAPDKTPLAKHVKVVGVP
jgi:hypothetical protein